MYTPLKILMTQSFQNSQLPEDWRLAIVKPIFKKGDKFQAVNYRPISLTAVIAKIMESIISDEIRKFLLANNVLPAEQHGFVPKKSVSTNLLCAVSDWTKNFDRGVATDVVYFDFCKAFDKVPITNLLLKLRHYGITGLLLEWIKGFLTNRSFRVKVGASLSDLTAVESGVPQGSVLGPLLFITYIADLKTEIQSRCLFYADDLKIYNDSPTNCSILSKDILIVNQWSKKWLLPINKQKCSVLHIGPNNSKYVYSMDDVVFYQYQFPIGSRCNSKLRIDME